MASRFYGIDKGAGTLMTGVTEGASTGSKGVEIQVDLSKVTAKIDILQALETLKQYIISRETDPAA
jgi:hypothetical protein